MTSNELIILNLDEVRRRSVKLWSGVTPDAYFWKPDKNAMHLLEMVRHVLEGEHLFHVIINERGNLGNYCSPWQDRPYVDLQAELDFADSYRQSFMECIRGFNPMDFLTIEIIRSEKGQRRKLGDYLLRIAYHESVHAGQMLSYLRTLGLERPQIWD